MTRQYFIHITTAFFQTLAFSLSMISLVGIATGWTTWVQFPAAYRPALGPTHPMQSVLEAVSIGVERQKSEADHSPTSSAEVKNGGIYLQSTIRLQERCLINLAQAQLYLILLLITVLPLHIVSLYFIVLGTYYYKFIVLGTYYCMFAFYGIMLFTSYCIVFPFYCIIFVRIMYVFFTFYCIGLYYCIRLFYLFIFFCTRVGLLPPGANPIAVKN
jgi:hypothetical protein